MKKFITALLLVSTIACSAVGVSASEKGTAYGKVPATDAKITIDGKKDDIYDKGLTIKTNTPNASNKSDSGASAEAKILWNGKDTFYVYVSVTDKEIIKKGKVTEKQWETDSVEIFFDYSNKVARTRDQYRIDCENNAQYYDTATKTSDADMKAFGFVNHAASIGGNGYAVEFEIKAYKEAISANMNVGFHMMLNDMVAAGRNMFDSDKCGNTPANFGYITLSGDKVAIEAPKPAAADTKTAAKTADMGVVVSALTLAMTSGALVVLKKRK